MERNGRHVVALVLPLMFGCTNIGGRKKMTKPDTQTTPHPFAHRKQTMKFEVELNGIGWDFSLGMIIDELRKAGEPAFPHLGG